MKEKFKALLYSERGEKFKDFIFGFQDGLISTYVLLVGISFLVSFNATLLLITLLAEVAAGAISMGFGSFISIKTKNEYLIKLNDKEAIRDPVDNALYMGSAFVLGGLLSVAPYFFPTPIWSFLLATILSFSALFIIGIFRSFYSEKHWIKPALEMLLIGILAVVIIEIYLYFILLSYEMLILG